MSNALWILFIDKRKANSKSGLLCSREYERNPEDERRRIDGTDDDDDARECTTAMRPRWKFFHQLPRACAHTSRRPRVVGPSASTVGISSRRERPSLRFQTSSTSVSSVALEETTNKQKKQKRILPFSRTKPTHHRSFARTPSPVYLRTRKKARSPKLERRRRSNRTRRAGS